MFLSDEKQKNHFDLVSDFVDICFCTLIKETWSEPDSNKAGWKPNDLSFLCINQILSISSGDVNI